MTAFGPAVASLRWKPRSAISLLGLESEHRMRKIVDQQDRLAVSDGPVDFRHRWLVALTDIGGIKQRNLPRQERPAPRRGLPSIRFQLPDKVKLWPGVK